MKLIEVFWRIIRSECYTLKLNSHGWTTAGELEISLSELVSTLMLNGFSYSGELFSSALIATLLRKRLHLRNCGHTISMGLGLKGMTSERDASIFRVGAC